MGRKRRREERLMKELRRHLRKRRRKSYSSESSELEFGSDKDSHVSYDNTPSRASSVTDETIRVIEDIDKENQLDNDILTLLGDAPREESPIGQDIHADIAKRFENILQNGLKKEEKDKIVEEYPVPGNCQMFKAPILNPEVKAAVSNLLQKKDASLTARQAQIGVALSSLSIAINTLVGEKSDTSQMIIKHVSNACRLLCDSHYIDTKIRRSFLISTLNSKLKDTLKETKRDKHLFGETLSESLKATKAINQSSLDLKSYVAKPKPAPRNNRLTNSNSNLNWKHPQPNQNMNSKTTQQNHRTAGNSTSRRNETRRETRREDSARANRNNARYRNQRRP